MRRSVLEARPLRGHQEEITTRKQARVHAHTLTCARTHTHTRTFACIHVYTHTPTHKHTTHTHTHTHTHARVSTHTHKVFTIDRKINIIINTLWCLRTLLEYSILYNVQLLLKAVDTRQAVILFSPPFMFVKS
jgi:hypothetical protein